MDAEPAIAELLFSFLTCYCCCCCTEGKKVELSWESAPLRLRLLEPTTMGAPEAIWWPPSKFTAA